MFLLELDVEAIAIGGLGDCLDCADWSCHPFSCFNCVSGNLYLYIG